jgi:hypothetical protein
VLRLEAEPGLHRVEHDVCAGVEEVLVAFDHPCGETFGEEVPEPVVTPVELARYRPFSRWMPRDSSAHAASTTRW